MAVEKKSLNSDHPLRCSCCANRVPDETGFEIVRRLNRRFGWVMVGIIGAGAVALLVLLIRDMLR